MKIVIFLFFCLKHIPFFLLKKKIIQASFSISAHTPLKKKGSEGLILVISGHTLKKKFFYKENRRKSKIIWKKFKLQATPKKKKEWWLILGVGLKLRNLLVSYGNSMVGIHNTKYQGMGAGSWILQTNQRYKKKTYRKSVLIKVLTVEISQMTKQKSSAENKGD